MMTKTATIEARVAAMKSLTAEAGLVTDATIAQYNHDVHDVWTPANGAALIARAWTDAVFKERLLENGREVAAEMGFAMPEHHRRLGVLENTASVHNVICCTLCSCTAITIIGMAPGWYKNLDYRARIVRESRTVLQELGLALPEDMKVKVWDTTADTRYMVLPLRPAYTEGWSEAQLAQLVTQDAMIGVTRLEAPFAPPVPRPN